VAAMAEVDTVTAGVAGSFTSLADATAASDATTDPLLTTDTDSSSIGVYITIFQQQK